MKTYKLHYKLIFTILSVPQGIMESSGRSEGVLLLEREFFDGCRGTHSSGSIAES